MGSQEVSKLCNHHTSIESTKIDTEDDLFIEDIQILRN